MSLNDTVAAERVTIGFFGVRNAGKSSVVNAVTGQDLAVVSDVAGTTTDPVRKTMELLPLGPVVIIDTPGFDDEGGLGDLRVRKTRRVLDSTDIAVLVVDATRGFTECDRDLMGLFEERKVPYVVAFNKRDLLDGDDGDGFDRGVDGDAATIAVSAVEGTNIHELKELIAHISGNLSSDRPLVSDLLDPGDTVVLVTPIDSSAPKGRLILPQQQVIRDVLESGCAAYVTRETELQAVLDSLREPPSIVITDSQAFGPVSRTVPPEIPLTSFSIVFARYKGDLREEVKGAVGLDDLVNGDRVLVAEGCTHHRQCMDIGTVKMPRWVSEYTNADLEFDFISGNDFPDDLSPYGLVIHCGGCMVNRREMLSRIERARKQGIPITNYGVAIARMKGILPRVLSPFEERMLLGV